MFVNVRSITKQIGTIAVQAYNGILPKMQIVSFGHEPSIYAYTYLVADIYAGLNETLSILLVGCVCTFYSSLGGMKAVLMTDVLQSLLMFIAIFIVLITGLQRYSLSQVMDIAYKSGRVELFK